MIRKGWVFLLTGLGSSIILLFGLMPFINIQIDDIVRILLLILGLMSGAVVALISRREMNKTELYKAIHEDTALIDVQPDRHSNYERGAAMVVNGVGPR